MEEKLERARRRMQFCMSLIGGCFGAYMVLRFGHFASAATVNLLEMFMGATQGNWTLALLRLGGMTLYVAAIVLTSLLSGRRGADLRRWAIWIDAAAALILSLTPEGAEHGVFISLFAMAFQWTAFSGEHGCPFSTIFSTNNLRQFVDALVQARLDRSRAEKDRIVLCGGSLLSFYAGVLLVGLLWRMEGGRWAILATLPPAAAALFWHRQYRRAWQSAAQKLR